MSESDKSKESSEEEEEQEQNSEEEQQKSEDEQQDEQNEEDEEEENQDENSNEEEDQQQEQNQDEADEKQEKEEEQYQLPSFPKLKTDPYQDKMSIDYISSELASLEFSVNSFIGSLSSQQGVSSHATKTNPKLTSFTGDNFYVSQLPLSSAGFQKTNNYKYQSPQESTKPAPVHIKDFEIQVDMQPQIIIQNVSKLPPLEKKSNSYIINSEASNYLSKLENNSKEGLSRFERKQDDLIDWEQRNKEIDQAMRMMKQKY